MQSLNNKSEVFSNNYFKYRKLNLTEEDYEVLVNEFESIIKITGIEHNFISVYSFDSTMGDKTYYVQFGDFDLTKSQFRMGLSMKIENDPDTGKVCWGYPTIAVIKYFVSSQINLADSFPRFCALIQRIMDEISEIAGLQLICEGRIVEQVVKKPFVKNGGYNNNDVNDKRKGQNNNGNNSSTKKNKR